MFQSVKIALLLPLSHAFTQQGTAQNVSSNLCFVFALRLSQETKHCIGCVTQANVGRVLALLCYFKRPFWVDRTDQDGATQAPSSSLSVSRWCATATRPRPLFQRFEPLRECPQMNQLSCSHPLQQYRALNRNGSSTLYLDGLIENISPQK